MGQKRLKWYSNHPTVSIVDWSDLIKKIYFYFTWFVAWLDPVQFASDASEDYDKYEVIQWAQGSGLMNRTILVVDDDKKIVDLVALYLKKEGYNVLTAYDGQEALDVARRKQPDLIVLDLLLPELDGTDVCRLLRHESNVPIIMLTARSTDEDKLLGLDIGADDYLTKPFNPRELVARIRAVLRRVVPDEESAEDLHFGELTISLVRHEVLLGGTVISLTPTEFRLLETLVREPGRAFARSELLDRAFGYDYEGVERTIDVHIMNLRRKIEPEPGKPRYIATVPGLGYRFEGRQTPTGHPPAEGRYVA
jgi:DNA-binding response OmpR family regulator